MKKAKDMLKEYREGYAGIGMKQTTLAERTGKSSSRISALENGNIKITADELLEIIVVGFQTTPSKFFAQELSENENT